VEFLDALFAALKRDEEIAAKLAGGDPAALQRMLPLSLVHLATFRAHGRPDAILVGIGERQNRHGRDIRPHLYDKFLTQLLGVVARYDKLHDERVRAAWEEALTPGLEYLKSQW
jgi:hypothetical protein